MASLIEALGDAVEKVNEMNHQSSVNYTTLMVILVEKGIVTKEELNRARIKATHLVDQVDAEKRAARIAEKTHRPRKWKNG